MDINRLFLIGCPRSGTTLLQSMVASHSQVVSFPETHFFSKTLPINPILRRAKLYGSKNRTVVKKFLNDNGYAQLEPFSELTSYHLLGHNQWCQRLINILDQMTRHDASDEMDSGPIWGLEKTPRHLYYISSIEQSDTSNKFLHILRKGNDVVASLHLATKRYPEQWGGRRSVKKCINWWNDSVRESLKYRNQPNHLFVTYGQLLKSPEKILQQICQFLEINFEESMLEDFHNTADNLTTENEKWKQKNAHKSLNKSNKLQRYFDSSTIRYIKENTLDIDLREFYH